MKLSGIQPWDTVLELGHGPGLGLEAAAKLLTDPRGHLIGVDYSKYMHQVSVNSNMHMYYISIQRTKETTCKM